MILYKACPKCGGDLLLIREPGDDPEHQCLQCGKRVPIYRRQPRPPGTGYGPRLVKRSRRDSA